MVYELGVDITVPITALPPDSKVLEMLWIRPGVFMMGSPADEPGHSYEDTLPFEVTLTKGFWLSKYPITQAQYRVVMDNNPSHIIGTSIDCPVENVSWHDAIAFCEVFNKQLASDLPEGYLFSLPTEAQWEYTCRADAQVDYRKGINPKELSKRAWHKKNSHGKTHPVGEKQPNPWGLYDMLGNVMAWCFDAPSEYPRDPTIDWVGNGDTSFRTMRGSAWSAPPSAVDFRCSASGYAEPETKRPWFGFRLSIRAIH